MIALEWISAREATVKSVPMNFGLNVNVTVISKSLRPVIRNYVFLLSILSRIQITATAGIFCS